MPLPSASAPQLRKTEVIRVDCYFLGGEAGTIELHNVHIIDFKEAFKTHPDEWALVDAIESEPKLKPYKMPVGPHAPKIIDKRNIPDFPTSEQMSSAAPPMVEMIPLHERRGPGGGPLIPRKG